MPTPLPTPSMRIGSTGHRALVSAFAYHLAYPKNRPRGDVRSAGKTWAKMAFSPKKMCALEVIQSDHLEMPQRLLAESFGGVLEEASGSLLSESMEEVIWRPLEDSWRKASRILLAESMKSIIGLLEKASGSLCQNQWNFSGWKMWN